MVLTVITARDGQGRGAMGELAPTFGLSSEKIVGENVFFSCVIILVDLSKLVQVCYSLHQFALL